MSNHLKILRLKAKIKTAKTAATKLKISTSTVYHMEEGINKPSPQLAEKMAKLYNCTLDEIFLPYNMTDSHKKPNLLYA